MSLTILGRPVVGGDRPDRSPVKDRRCKLSRVTKTRARAQMCVSFRKEQRSSVIVANHCATHLSMVLTLHMYCCTSIVTRAIGLGPARQAKGRTIIRRLLWRSRRVYAASAALLRRGPTPKRFYRATTGRTMSNQTQGNPLVSIIQTLLRLFCGGDQQQGGQGQGQGQQQQQQQYPQQPQPQYAQQHGYPRPTTLLRPTSGPIPPIPAIRPPTVRRTGLPAAGRTAGAQPEWPPGRMELQQTA